MSAVSGLMSASRPHTWLKASLQPAPLLCLFMIFVLWTVFATVLLVERQRAVDSAIVQGSNLVRLFEQNTASMLRDVDRTLILLRQIYENDPARFDFNNWVKRTIATEKLAAQFAIMGQDGWAKTLSASQGIVSTVYLGDREYFQQQRNAKDDKLVVSSPMLGRLSNKWTVFLTRRLRNPDGSFAGLVGASIDPNFIGSFYKTIDVGKQVLCCCEILTE
jgi:hypothetical protein